MTVALITLGVAVATWALLHLVGKLGAMLDDYEREDVDA